VTKLVLLLSGVDLAAALVSFFSVADCGQVAFHRRFICSISRRKKLYLCQQKPVIDAVAGQKRMTWNFRSSWLLTTGPVMAPFLAMVAGYDWICASTALKRF